ncbi:MAG: ribosome small subunit-dependent GTPase A [Microbacteriaceae bacterium]
MTWGNEHDTWDRYDESSAKVRPPKRGSRPRTKTRPAHDDAVTGLIMTVDRGRYLALVDEGTPEEREVVVKRAKEMHRTSVVTGDRVDLVGDTTGAPGTLARMVRIQDRDTVLRRSADDTDQVERMIVANADRMLIVVAAANPEPRERLVDRYLVAAFDAGIQPILVITKTDLADPTEFLRHFRTLDIPIVLSRSDEPPLDELTELLRDHVTVAVGHSGVGKSTLVNALVPSAQRATGKVNDVTGRGRHTSSSTVSFRFPGGGWLIDTPGVRSFGLGHVKPDSVLAAFTDLAELAEECPRGCDHRADDCEIVAAVVRGELGETGVARLDSVHRLFDSMETV